MLFTIFVLFLFAIPVTVGIIVLKDAGSQTAKAMPFTSRLRCDGCGKLLKASWVICPYCRQEQADKSSAPDTLSATRDKLLWILLILEVLVPIILILIIMLIAYDII